MKLGFVAELFLSTLIIAVVNAKGLSQGPIWTRLPVTFTLYRGRYTSRATARQRSLHSLAYVARNVRGDDGLETINLTHFVAQ